MNIGSYRIFSLPMGYLSLDGGAMFGVVPRTLWSKSFAPDSHNRIRLVMRLLIVEGNGRLIVVDTGIGTKMEEKWQKIYGLNPKENDLRKELARFGLDYRKVTDVILTHLHFDHAGGATTIIDGKLQVTFPHANHYVQKKQWQWALRPSEKDRASYLPENFQPLQDNDLLVILDGPCELFPGIHLKVVHGHTPGMQLPFITDGNTHLIHGADLIPTAAHLPLPYIMAYDNHPLTTLQEKKQFLEQIEKEHRLLFFEHDPHHVAGFIHKGEKYYQLEREVNF